MLLFAKEGINKNYSCYGERKRNVTDIKGHSPIHSDFAMIRPGNQKPRVSWVLSGCRSIQIYSAIVFPVEDRERVIIYSPRFAMAFLWMFLYIYTYNGSEPDDSTLTGNASPEDRF